MNNGNNRLDWSELLRVLLEAANLSVAFKGSVTAVLPNLYTTSARPGRRMVTAIAGVLLFLLATPLAAICQPSSSTTRHPVFLATVTTDPGDSLLTPETVAMALGIALDLTPSYRLLPMPTRDSILDRLQHDGQRAEEIFAASGIRHAVVVQCRRIANLVRTSVVLLHGTDLARRDEGIGYATIRHRDDASGRVLAQPAVLASVQRACLGAMGDPTLYRDAAADLRVASAPLVSIGGIVFTSDATLPTWSLFRESITASFDAANTVVNEMVDLDTLTVIDLETRDSLFAKAGLLMMENYNASSGLELGILHQFDVSYVITGTFRRVAEGAELRLVLNVIDPGKESPLSPVLSSQCMVTSDSKVAFQAAVALATRRLFGRSE